MDLFYRYVSRDGRTIRCAPWYRADQLGGYWVILGRRIFQDHYVPEIRHATMLEF